MAGQRVSHSSRLLVVVGQTGEFTVHQVFANVYYDFRNGSRWTPFAGAGVGRAAVDLNYYLQFFRKPEAEYLQIEFDPDWPDVAKRAAAGDRQHSGYVRRPERLRIPGAGRHRRSGRRGTRSGSFERCRRWVRDRC